MRRTTTMAARRLLFAPALFGQSRLHSCSHFFGAVVTTRVPRVSSKTRRGVMNATAVTPSVQQAVSAEPDTPIVLPTNESSPRLLRARHTAAHVLAMAVQRLFPDARVTIGPWIADGFYYDFDAPEPFTDADLKRIQKEMSKIMRQRLPLIREEVPREEARERIEALNEPYKLEILNGIQDPVTLYHIGDKWWDLCAGPHLEHTGELDPKSVALESVAGAYWRGDEKNAMLQRIYGTAWETPAQLQEYLRRKEEAKRRDHRVLGPQLGLFSIQEDAGGGLVFWHPKGATVRRVMEDFWKDAHVRAGYELLYTPHVANASLWKTSGHLDFYSDSMFKRIPVDNEEYQLKPMNCPFHCLVFADGLRSYRDLPLRWAELGTVYRYERSGTLHGLMRVRGFTQDDAHVFCLPEQLAGEIRRVLDLTETILGRFGFREYDVMLSTRPEKSVGTDDGWANATASLEKALQEKGWEYSTDEGGGAFYGPKIDVKIRDAIGRQWQCSTVQVDFNLPERFGLQYVDKDGERRRPIMVHRAIFGSVERFFGVLVESYAGEFPLWLAPVQLRLLPVTEDARDACIRAKEHAVAEGLRVEIDNSGDRLAKMVRNAQKERIPLFAVVGAKEVEAGTLSLRSRKSGDLGVFPVEDVVQTIKIAADHAVDYDAVDDRHSKC